MRRNPIHPGCRAEILIPTSLERDTKKKGPSLDKSGPLGRQSLLRRGGSAPVSHHLGKNKPHAHAHAPPPLPWTAGGTSPGSSVAPYRGDRSRIVSPVSHCFCFLPDREVLGAKGSSRLLRAGSWGTLCFLFTSRSTAGVRARDHLSPCFPLGVVDTCQIGRFFAS